MPETGIITRHIADDMKFKEVIPSMLAVSAN